MPDDATEILVKLCLLGPHFIRKLVPLFSGDGAEGICILQLQSTLPIVTLVTAHQMCRHCGQGRKGAALTAFKPGGNSAFPEAVSRAEQGCMTDENLHSILKEKRKCGKWALGG